MRIRYGHVKEKVDKRSPEKEKADKRSLEKEKVDKRVT